MHDLFQGKPCPEHLDFFTGGSAVWCALLVKRSIFLLFTDRTFVYKYLGKTTLSHEYPCPRNESGPETQHQVQVRASRGRVKADLPEVITSGGRDSGSLGQQSPRIQRRLASCASFLSCVSSYWYSPSFFFFQCKGLLWRWFKREVCKLKLCLIVFRYL